MLDTDTPDTTADAAPEATDTGASTAPVPRKRAPRKATSAATRKATPPTLEAPASDAAPADAVAPAVGVAPRKRAPRKAAAKKPAAADPVAIAATDAPEADSGPAQQVLGSDAVPAKRAPRKRVTKATSAPASAAVPAETLPAADAATGPVDALDPAVTALTALTEPAPTKRAPRKRAAKKSVAEPAADSAATGIAAAARPAVDEPGPATMSTPGVLFMSPDDAEPQPTRRRRTAKKAAGAPVAADNSALDAADAAPTARSTDAASTDAATTSSASTSDADGADNGDDADPDDVREAAIEQANGARRRRRRGRRGRGGAGRTDDTDEATSGDDGNGRADDPDTSEQGEGTDDSSDDETADDAGESGGSSRRRRRRRRSNTGDDSSGDDTNDPPNTVTHVREKKSGNKDSGKSSGGGGDDDGVRGIKGSTRLEAKRQRRRDGRETTRRRAPILTEAEFLARREAVDRVMAVRQLGDRTQIAVLEDEILVEHYVTRASATSYVGNVYLGRVQNVLPSMEAAFVDIGKGRNGVLYAGEVNWDAAGLDGKSRTIEHAMKSGDSVLVQVTKDPIGHKGARLTSQVSLPGRFLVYVPGGGMTGISRRLPDTERHRLKSILKKIVPDEAGVIVRTAAEGASEEDLTHDVERLQAQWESIETQAKAGQGSKNGSPTLLHGEPDLAIRVVRDVFNEDFTKLVVEGSDAWSTVSEYVSTVAPDLGERVSQHGKDSDLFRDLRVDEQLAKALDRKVYLPSGGSLVIDRTEAMTVVDVNTGRFVGSGGNLEQTVTRNNLEAAEEIVRQLRLRDVGGIVVIDFIDMVLESNRDLVLRRLTECLGRDRTKHQVAEVTSLGLVQMTRKRVGEGLLEAFSEPCEHCHGRGVLIHTEPVDQQANGESDDEDRSGGRKRGRRGGRAASEPAEVEPPASPQQRQAATAAIAAIHRATSTTEGDDADTAGTPSALTTLANDLVNAAMDADTTASASRSSIAKADAQREVEPAGVEPAEVADPEISEDADSAAPEPAGAPSGSDGPDAAPPARRRRRAASRPAGPPVHA